MSQWLVFGLGMISGIVVYKAYLKLQENTIERFLTTASDEEFEEFMKILEDEINKELNKNKEEK